LTYCLYFRKLISVFFILSTSSGFIDDVDRGNVLDVQINFLLLISDINYFMDSKLLPLDQPFDKWLDIIQK